jgi:hypothetical protein
MNGKKKYLIVIIIFSSNSILNTAHAEIGVIKKGQLKGERLSPIQFQFGGQLRPEWIFKSGQ